MNYLLWLEFITNLAKVVAEQNGAAPRELAYLGLLSRASTVTSLTDADLTELKTKYENEVATNIETSPEELLAIVDRIQARGDRIQNA
jgi:hypothetical protein